MKCNQSRPGFELGSPCPFPTTITITPRTPPKLSHVLFPEEEKGCYKETRETGSLQYINQYILKEDKSKRENLTMQWIDYKKAYDMVPRFENFEDIQQRHEIYHGSYKKLKSWIGSRRKNFSWGENPERHIPEDALSPLLCVIVIIHSITYIRSVLEATNLQNRKKR